MKTTNIKASAIRKLAKARGRRVSTEFLEALDKYVADKVNHACDDHNGGRKTLDVGIAMMYFSKGLGIPRN